MAHKTAYNESHNRGEHAFQRGAQRLCGRQQRHAAGEHIAFFTGHGRPAYRVSVGCEKSLPVFLLQVRLEIPRQVFEQMTVWFRRDMATMNSIRQDIRKDVRTHKSKGE